MLKKEKVDLIYKFYKDKKIDLPDNVFNWLYEIADKKFTDSKKSKITDRIIDAVDLMFDEKFSQAESLFKKLYNEYKSLETVKEEVSSGDVASGTQSSDIAEYPEKMFGKPLFRLDDDMFFKVGFSNRKEKGWYSKFYGTEMGNWCKHNKGKKFMIKHKDKDIYIECEVK